MNIKIIYKKYFIAKQILFDQFWTKTKLSYINLLIFRDEAGSSSSTRVEVNVSQGPNLRPPTFEKLVYDTQV